MFAILVLFLRMLLIGIRFPRKPGHSEYAFLVWPLYVSGVYGFRAIFPHAFHLVLNCECLPLGWRAFGNPACFLAR